VLPGLGELALQGGPGEGQAAAHVVQGQGHLGA
jgi:hypothetical protein